MLQSRTTKFQAGDGVLHGSLNYPQIWNDGETGPAGLTYIGMGDPFSGPAIALFNFAPGALLREFAHSHRTDTFRIAVADQPDQVKDGARWLGAGDFLLMGANDVYVEQVGPDGMMMVGVFADRRGVPHGYDVSQDPTDRMTAEWPERSKRHFMPEHSFPVHQRNEDAVVGVATSFAELPQKRPRLYGSTNDDANWRRLSDGSTLGAMLMSDWESGPLLLLSNNAAGAVEAPTATYRTDVFRLVIRGEVRIGDRTYGAHQFRAIEAGVREGPVVHGPRGSTQALLFADRRAWIPDADDAVAAERWPRLGEIEDILEPFIATASLV